MKVIESLLENRNRFSVNGSDITILNTPSSFYEALITEVKKANKRVSISALYIGTGWKEEFLIKQLEKSLDDKPQLNVSILVDKSRGTRLRSDKSTATLCANLASEHPKNTRVSFFEMPQLQSEGRIKMPLSQLEEAIAVFHMKAYVFDDTIIMSGANLSEDYFTNRQDRYIMIRNVKHLCDWYTCLLEEISNASHRLLPSGKLKSPGETQKDLIEVQETLKRRMVDLLQDRVPMNDAHDTIIAPTIQFKVLGIVDDENITMNFLKEWSNRKEVGKLDIASGYLNLTETYQEALLSTGMMPSNPHRNAQRNTKDTAISAVSKASIITSSPQANGFYTASGILSGIPMIYSELEREFWNRIQQKKARIDIQEYSRTGWTFHAKGMWLTLNNNNYNNDKNRDNDDGDSLVYKADFPVVTFIGSPNFGYRSVERDLESQIIIFTKNDKLQSELHKELQLVTKYCERVSEFTWERPGRFISGVFSWRQGVYLNAAKRLIRTFL